MIIGTPIASIGFSAVIAPRVEMYTVLVCRVHAPEYGPSDIHLVQPHSMLSVNTTGAQDEFTLEVSSVAQGSIQPLYLYVPPSPSPSRQHVPDRNQCTSDPVVQADVAQLSAGLFVVFFNREELISGVVLTTSMGILSCLTTAWWGSVRHYIRVIDTGCNLPLSSSQIALAEH